MDRALRAMFVALFVGGCAAARPQLMSQMFQPLPPGATAATVPGMLPGDWALATDTDGGVRVYPLTLLAYHHIIHDHLGGKPAVATY